MTVEERSTDHPEIRQNRRSEVPPEELHPYAKARPQADTRRHGQARALATISSLIVNVITI